MSAQLQAGAFADYQPGEGGDAAPASSDGGGSDDKPAEPSGGGEQQPEPASGGEGGGGGGGGGGNFPPHIMLNMPALSPTMESGQQALSLWPYNRSLLEREACSRGPAVLVGAPYRGLSAACVGMQATSRRGRSRLAMRWRLETRSPRWRRTRPPWTGSRRCGGACSGAPCCTGHPPGLLA